MYHFIIRFPNAEILTCETDTWEYIGMNDVKITFNGTVYITSMSNVVISYDEQEYKEALERNDTRRDWGFETNSSSTHSICIGTPPPRPQ